MITAARGALAGLLAISAARLVALPAEDCHRPHLGCLPVALLTVAIAMLAAITVGWLVAWVLRLRRPWLVGIVGPFAMLGLTWVVAMTGIASGGDPWWWFFGFAPVAYTVPALLATLALRVTWSPQRGGPVGPATREQVLRAAAIHNSRSGGNARLRDQADQFVESEPRTMSADHARAVRAEQGEATDAGDGRA
ncbi:hypothetical protein [Catellatospora sichuanensis]|uniref:hypothetical protein n=1 Tax=Catellatospora sichuanensis TaxID=1969805 RepID=UPI001182F1DE|nr:hypothetical protein [Catellatospora sichuanensis]